MAGKRKSASGRSPKGQKELADTADRLELARIVTARIDQLGLTRSELEKRSGVSVATIREIEHPKKPRKFGRKVLEPISEALELPSGHLVRVAYRSSSEAPDPIVQAMMAALAPYLEKIDAIPGLQEDVAAIKAGLGGTIDSNHETAHSVDDDSMPGDPDDPEHR